MNQEKQREAYRKMLKKCPDILTPMKMIQDWLGHSDMGTTANIYSHIDSESKKASAMAIGSALG
jgi:integrase